MARSLHSRASTTPSTADRQLKALQQSKYVKEFWLFLAGVIALLTIINATSRLLACLAKPKQHPVDAAYRDEKRSPEAFTPGRTGRISLRRFPHALASAFKIVAFRVTVPIGPSSVASVTEVVFIVGYLAALLAFLWVDSECPHCVTWTH